MAEFEFLTDIQLNGQQVKNARVENVGSLPTSDISSGRIVFLETTGDFYVGVQGQWVRLANANDLSTLNTSSQIEIVKNGNSYTIKQGGVALTPTIDIPKDMVVESGSIVKGNWSNNTFSPSDSGTGKALALVIANGGGTVYINVADLVDAYSGASTSTVSVSISSDNKISANIVAGSITESLLSSTLLTTLKSATITAPTASSTQATAGTLTISALFQTIVNNIKQLFTSLNNKVDKVTGKGLSTNDFTTEEKNKLASLKNVYSYKSAYLVGSSGSITVTDSGLKTGLPTLVQALKKGTLCGLQLSYDETTGAISWSSNMKLTADDYVHIVAHQIPA